MASRSTGCPFDKLSDELVTVILRKACQKEVSHASLPKLPKVDPHVWMSARTLNRFKAVCRRFQNLDTQDIAQHLVWEFERAESLIGAAMLSQLGGHVRGLTLSYKDLRLEDLQAGASMEYLVAVLRLSPNLESFFLNCSSIRHSAEASLYVLGLLARVPLQSLWLLQAGFHFSKPLTSTQQFSELRNLKIASSVISDPFLHSVLKQSPELKTLCLDSCRGLNEPHVKSASLQKLVMRNVEADTCELMVVDAPNLTVLKGVPGLPRLDLCAPRLESLWVEGPIQLLNVAPCKINLSVLHISGSYWWWADVQRLLGELGASKRFSLEVDDWHEMNEYETLSCFLKMSIPRTVEWLSLGTASTQLLHGYPYTREPEAARLEALKKVDFTLVEAADFDLFQRVLVCCPNLEGVSIDLTKAPKGVDGSVVSRAVHLQKVFPHVKMVFKEPRLLVSSEHLLELAGSKTRLSQFVATLKSSSFLNKSN